MDVFLVGAESLLIHCGERLLANGHRLTCVVSDEKGVRNWAIGHGVRVLPHTDDLSSDAQGIPCELVLSVGNRRILGDDFLRLAPFASINFHDGPLPHYSGLNAPNWAIFDGAREHGVTWHKMTSRADAGAILARRSFSLEPNESARTLNARCFEAGIDSFEEVLRALEANQLDGTPHTLDTATRHGRADLPLKAAIISFREAATTLNAMSRGLDFGNYPNPIALPRLAVANNLYSVREIVCVEHSGASQAGSILSVDDDGLVVSCAEGAVRLRGITDSSGSSVTAQLISDSAGADGKIAELEAATVRNVSATVRDLSRREDFWIARLGTIQQPDLRNTGATIERGRHRDRLDVNIPAQVSTAIEEQRMPGGRIDFLVAAFGAFLARRWVTASNDPLPHIDIAFQDDALRDLEATHKGWVAPFVPLRFVIRKGHTLRDFCDQTAGELALVRKHASFVFDLPSRLAGAAAMPFDTAALNFGVESYGSGRVAEGARTSAFTLLIADAGTTCKLDYDAGLFSHDWVTRLLTQFSSFLATACLPPFPPVAGISILAPAEINKVLQSRKSVQRVVDFHACIHDLISRSASSRPDHNALVAGDGSVSYAELERRSNQLANFLVERGIQPRSRVAVAFDRTLDTVVSLLAVLKSGAAYVPLDPSHPRERSLYVLEDSGAELLLTHSHLLPDLPASSVPTLSLDMLAKQVESLSHIGPTVSLDSSELAYVMYTSGSTGHPKGVMVEHRNVVNLFAALDERIPVESSSVWLAVTSVTFDISVLELLWTLTRGVTVVLHSDARHRSAAVRESSPSRQVIDFSLFYFSADAGDSGAAAYRLLLEGAKFGDENGFTAVWTPERHFHEFGGIYPNPAITAAAVASITQRIGIRAGSVVLPLHHPIRVAEDWSVVDNLSHGRVGISFASGWQPNDFVIRPENFKGNKERMIADIDVVQRLWRGETIAFPGPLGTDVSISTLPRPVQPELPTWMTTAGNPESYRLAGEKGLRVLTHLLGQTVDDLKQKIAVYQEAWTKAGHPGKGYVTLMLHTFVADDEQYVRDTVRLPLKNYLRSSVSLIRDFASTFPAIKKPAHGELDFKSLSAEEMDALLEYSVERYYETSGLFGSPARCATLVRKLSDMGVSEIACLIDFGIDPQIALAELHSLNKLRMSFVSTAEFRDEGRAPSIVELLARHTVTHMQCTPSMARLLISDATARKELSGIRVLLVGGEALPSRLAAELRGLVRGEIHNMYGPTETTVWSTSHRIDEDSETVPIGKAFANTYQYVVDEFGQLVNDGSPGELWIGGAGVARGYHNRPELTSQRFVPDPFIESADDRFYRTGDLVRENSSGQLVYLGRIDDQVKILGHRIELGEIETVLASHVAVEQCAVVASGDDDHGFHLEAFLIASPACPNDAGLREFLRQQLPDAMIPSRFIRVASLPLNTNGKIDRRALRSLAVQGPAPRLQTQAVAMPTSDLEEHIAKVWREVLGIDQVGMLDNFFDIGGHSLLAVRVHARLKGDLRTELSITDLFRYPTVRSLAEHLTVGRRNESAPNISDSARDRAALRRNAQHGRRPRPK